ncbi:MAG TPA: transcriptional regulator, partial [Firmicutes bacterium]|nr:transcriptional regulator [Bacillota bacterium]
MENTVRELRTKLNMTQEELAAQAGVSRQTIISIESGRYNPSIMLAYKIARHFGLPIEEVFLCEKELEEE